jgi:NAD/NADP transhydrogenase beta subunit
LADDFFYVVVVYVVCMAPGIFIGLMSAYFAKMTDLPELVGAYNGLGGLAAALEGIGLYLDPSATQFVRGGDNLGPQTDAMLWVQSIALILSIVIGEYVINKESTVLFYLV